MIPYGYVLVFFFFFNDTATTEIYTLSLHDALPIWDRVGEVEGADTTPDEALDGAAECLVDRKSTRLNSSHVRISYAVFCLKKKKKINTRSTQAGPSEPTDTASNWSRSLKT